MHYTLPKAAQIFSTLKNREISVVDLKAWSKSRKVTPPTSSATLANRKQLGWSGDQIGSVGEFIGALKRPARPFAVSVFVTKGGVLKTTLTLNMARIAALSGIKTVVVGLDMQCDITSALGFDPGESDPADLDVAFQALDSISGLNDYFKGAAGLEDIIQKSDLANLDFIPETPELVSLDQQLLSRPRREYWLSEKVVAPLLKKYDLVLLDCSPNWNHLITNALVASDLLLSPIECRINNYRNLKMFRGFVEQFRRDLNLSFQQVFVPTRLSPNRKLSREIYEWYTKNVPHCLPLAVREGIQGEEASALHLSVLEYAPNHTAAHEMCAIVNAVWSSLVAQARRTSANMHQQGAQPWL